MARFACLVAFCLVGWARDPAAAQEPLTVDRAVSDAIAGNPALRAARAAGAETADQVTAVESGWFPRVSVSESWQHGNQPVFVFSSLLASRQFAPANFAIDALNHPDAISFFQTSVSAEQVLFDGGRQRSTVRAARLRRQIADLETDSAAAALAVTVTDAYGRLLTVGARSRALTAALEAAREDLARSEHRRDAGAATDADVLSMAAHVADLQQRLIQSQGDAAIGRAELNRLLGAPVGREFTAVEPAVLASSIDAAVTLDALLAEADRARPELQRASAAEHLSDTARGAARAALLPQIAAQGGVDVAGTRFGDRASAWVLGGNARWSLSLGGAERAQLSAAANAAARARAEADDARAGVHVEVVTALRRLESARARQNVGRAAVEQARESERIIRDRFDAGVAPVTDVLRASSTVLDADAQRVSAVVDAMVSEAMLRRALGRRP